MVEAWHFVADTLRDGRPVPADGEWLVHEGAVEMCAAGLHASKRVMDALTYAPGSTLCRVECRGDIQEGEDKLVCRERRILWRMDAGPLLFVAARRFALEVAHLWDMPKVVWQWLETGDEQYRSAAWSAAESATWSAARDAQEKIILGLIEEARNG